MEVKIIRSGRRMSNLVLVRIMAKILYLVMVLMYFHYAHLNTRNQNLRKRHHGSEEGHEQGIEKRNATVGMNTNQVMMGIIQTIF